MKPDYKNWVPKGMICGFAAGTVALGAACAALEVTSPAIPGRRAVHVLLGTAALAGGVATGWFTVMHNRFSYDGRRQLSKQIVEGTAEYAELPEGGRGLDVGCGSGALTIACAKRNPQATMLGIDPWGPEYASFNKEVCMKNAEAEHVTNVSFQSGNAIKLDFPDETFDFVTSNYVYHNIAGRNKQELLRETLRVLKKGGTFAIHDLMGKARYGDMDRFVQSLKDEGYEEVRMIDTTDGMFMSREEARWMMLAGSALLVGKK